MFATNLLDITLDMISNDIKTFDKTLNGILMQTKCLHKRNHINVITNVFLMDFIL